VGSKKAQKRALKVESFDKDIEEAKTLRDIQRLEKKDGSSGAWPSWSLSLSPFWS